MFEVDGVSVVCDNEVDCSVAGVSWLLVGGVFVSDEYRLRIMKYPAIESPISTMIVIISVFR